MATPMPLRILTPVLTALALTACAAGPSADSQFTGGAAVNHPEALFNVASRGDQIRRNDARTGKPRGVPICPRISDLENYDILLDPRSPRCAVRARRNIPRPRASSPMP